MIFDIFISKKSTSLLHKLDEDLKEMLRVFYTLEGRYKRKLKFIKRCKEEHESGKVTAWGGKAILNETSRLLRVIGFEEKADKTEDRCLSKALNILKDLLERWRTNRKLVKLTYREYSDLSILHESLRNLISILHNQRIFLKRHRSNSPSFINNFTEFEELVRQEGIVIGKEKEYIETLEGETEQLVEEFGRDFTYSLVGYGSLMNADETMNELKSTLEKAGTPIRDISVEFKNRVTPVWVLGYKRVFNREIVNYKEWATEDDLKENRTAVLNVAASMNHKFNGVAIKLTAAEYEVIKKRENDYAATKLKYVYDYRSGKRITEECILVKSKVFKVDVPVDKKERTKFYADKIRRFAYGMNPDKILKSNRMPIPRYIEVIDIGVKKLDALLRTVGMYDNYLNTTFCYYIDRTAKRDYGEIKLIDYYKLIGKEIERRLQLNVI